MKSDLVILVADKDLESAIRGLIGRHPALGIRPVRYKLLVHPEHDPGCYRRAADLLRPAQATHEYALVVFDFEGSGATGDRQNAEGVVFGELSRSGWADRAAVIAIAPELEQWVWSDSPEVDQCLGWVPDLSAGTVRDWLEAEGFWQADAAKPQRPKEALERVLRRLRRPRSAALYGKLAERVSFKRCNDPAFLKLCETLQAWFPQGQE